MRVFKNILIGILFAIAGGLSNGIRLDDNFNKPVIDDFSFTMCHPRSGAC